MHNFICINKISSFQLSFNSKNNIPDSNEFKIAIVDLLYLERSTEDFGFSQLYDFLLEQMASLSVKPSPLTSGHFAGLDASLTRALGPQQVLADHLMVYNGKEHSPHVPNKSKQIKTKTQAGHNVLLAYMQIHTII